ncbi:MAG: hypothetical protein HPY52_02975 [Firmicutes bacterium]|nr:hypothetical protein [Bacillota bacterium]
MNVDMLEECGIDATRAPVSIAELDEMAAKISKRDASGKFNRVGFIPWLGNWYPAGWFWAFGSELYDANTKRPTLDKMENIKAFEWVQKYAQLYNPLDPGSGDSFLSGRLAMSADCSNPMLRLLKTDRRDLKVRVVEVPHAPGGTQWNVVGRNRPHHTQRSTTS